MPAVRKLSQEEVRAIEKRIKGQRKLIEEEYDALLEGYSAGEYGEAELENNENRITVRNRLKAAALRRNLVLDFNRTKGNILRFKVSPRDIAGAEAPADVVSSEAATDDTAPKTRGRRRKTA